MKKIQNTKLRLRTETIKTLDPDQLVQIVGAGKPPTYTNCYRQTCTC